MKVAFISDLSERFGVEYLSAMLKTRGHDTRLFMDPRLFNDGEFGVPWLAPYFDRKDDLLRELKAYAPDLVAFSAATDPYQWSIDLAGRIKRIMDVPVIFGGIHPTSVPERVIVHPAVDMVCVGEGEHAMLELVESMARGAVDHTIRNIWFKKDGDIVRNELRPLLQDLDALPFADKDIYYAVSPQMASCYFITTIRGCPQACSYCCHSYLRELYRDKGCYLRQRSVANIIDELVRAKKRYPLRVVRFWDDDFSVGRSVAWFREFAREYKSKVGLPFICYLYPKDVPEGIVACLKEAGCCEVSLGVQSWDASLRRTELGRDTSNEEFGRIIDMLHQHGINTTVDFICGLPRQHEQDDVLGFLRFCISRKVGEINFSGLQYFPRSQITTRLWENGLFTQDEYENILDGKNAHLTSLGGHLPFHEMIKYKTAALLMIFLPPKVSDRWIASRRHDLIARIFHPRLIDWAYNRCMRSHDRRNYTRCKYGQYMYFIMKKTGSIFRRGAS
jgi:radical SAM superfamily enzyme YgiQ (UPF0313 family)